MLGGAFCLIARSSMPFLWIFRQCCPSQSAKDIFFSLPAWTALLSTGCLRSAELLQTGSSPVSSRFANKTSNMQPPAPKTQKLGACSDPYKGGPPPPGSKSGSGCQLTPGSCFKLQGRFLRIQAGIVDEKEKLELQLHRLNKTVFRSQVWLTSLSCYLH